MTDRKKKELTIRSSAAEYLTFVAATGESDASYEMRYEDENIWLTQKMMASLYDVSVVAINQHLKRIFEDGELTEEAVVKKYLITATDGKKYNTNHYLIAHGGGFLVIPERDVPEFKQLLVKYYEGEGTNIISAFLKERCWKRF